MFIASKVYNQNKDDNIHKCEAIEKYGRTYEHLHLLECQNKQNINTEVLIESNINSCKIEKIHVTVKEFTYKHFILGLPRL